MNPILIVIPILTVLMFDLGLELRPADFGMLRRRPRAVAAGACGQLLLLPVLAWTLCRVLDLSPEVTLGMMLIACCPGGSSSNVFSALAGGDVALSVSLTAISSVVTLFTIPLILGAMVKLPLPQLIVQNIVLVLAPVAIGMALRHYKAEAAARIHGVLRRCAFPALLVLITVFFIQHRDTIAANIIDLGWIVALMILLSMGGGALLASASRLDTRERRTIVIEVGMQNAAQAIALASSPFVFNDSSLAIPAIIYSLLMNLILLPYVILCRRFQILWLK